MLEAHYLVLESHNLYYYISEPSLLGAPGAVRRDIRNQTSGQPPLLSRVLPPISSPSLQPHGGWLVEDDISRANLNNRPAGFAQECDSLKSDKVRGLQNPFAHGTSASTSTGLVLPASQGKVEEVSWKDI